MKKHLSIFLTGFIQVFLVAVNTYFLTKAAIWGVFPTAFLISFVWSFNVKKLALGNMTDRIIYSAGAASGSASGLLLSLQIIKHIQ